MDVDPNSVLLGACPQNLEQICAKSVLSNIVKCGRRVSAKARKVLPATGSNSTNNNNTNAANKVYKRRRKSSLTLMLDDASSTTFSGSGDEGPEFFFQSEVFIKAVAKGRLFLMTHLSTCALDTLMAHLNTSGSGHQISGLPEVQQSQRMADESGLDGGHCFAFCCLSNERLSSLNVSPSPLAELQSPPAFGLGNANANGEEGQGSATSNNSEKTYGHFGQTLTGSQVILDCIGHLTNLAVLSLKDICTNVMLYSIAESCTKLQTIDISGSQEVTDLGLLYLCGASCPTRQAIDRYLPKPPVGCKYLREVHYNQQRSINPVMPRVIAYMLKHLKYLRICEVERLADGIQYYLHGPEGGYHPRMSRIDPLKLAQFEGPSDKISEEILQSCPNIRRLRFHVTDDLENTGKVLANCPKITLEHVSIVHNRDHVPRTSSNAMNRLVGLDAFLSHCGQRINTLEVECEPDANILVQPSDLTSISQHCPLLDGLVFKNFRFGLEVPEGDTALLPSAVQLPTWNFRYLTSLRLTNVILVPDQDFGREAMKAILGGCPDLEHLELEFESTAFFFSDFLLDDILFKNPFARLETFLVSDASLTLISAMRLLNSRPKLKTIGRIMKWDVEYSELDTFSQILNKARHLNLLPEGIQFL